jgi:hypothetical protein
MYHPNVNFVALSRKRGPLGGATGSAPTPIADKLPVLSSSYTNTTQCAYHSYFSDISDTLSTKLLGIITLSKLIDYLDLPDPAEGLPLLNEVVQYGNAAVRNASGTGQGALDDLRKTLQDEVLSPLLSVLENVKESWDAVQAGTSGVPGVS